ncbi:MAG: flagellar filament capping protein FliD [Alphaproteobacteria bacterium]
MAGLNVAGLTIDANGRASFSGLSSGIDFQKAIDGIIAAKQIPADSLDKKITANEAKIAALKDLNTKLGALKDALASLRGTVTVDNTGNLFAAKQTFASTSRTDGLAPNSASNLIGVSVSNLAAAGSHTLEIRRIATAHKLGSNTFSSQSTALGYSGSFDVTGSTGTATITISATDTLQDIRDRINNANTGTGATGVSASIVQVSSNQFILSLTDKNTGSDITFANETGGILGAAKLGIYDSGGSTYLNELQAAQTAAFTADGLLDPKRFESDFIATPTAKLSTVAAQATFPGSIGITVGGQTVTVNYTSTDTVQNLTDNINAAIAAAGAGNAVFDAGTSASLVADGSGVRLVITDTSAAPITINDTNGLGAALGLDNQLVINRSSNTITDLFQGVTLTLFQAEEGTSIKLDIQQNLAGVKSGIQGFVSAYNDLKAFLNTQTLTDPNTGTKSSSAGVLFGSSTVANVSSQLSQILGSPVSGVSDAFTVLAQIGITFADPNTVSDPTKANSLVLDESKLDTALLNNPDDVQRLLTFDFSSSDPRVALLGFNSKTSSSATGYVLNIGKVGAAQQTGAAVLDKNAVLSDAVNSLGATTAGTFQINGVVITYDADGAGGNDDTLQTLADKIKNAGITGVTASVVADGANYRLQVNSTKDPIVVSGDTGDLVSKLGLTTDTYLVGQANIGGLADGTDNGTVTASGRSLTVTSGSTAEGLQVFYNGTSDVSGVQLGITVGLGTQLWSALNNMLDTTTGVVQTDIQSLTDQNKLADDRKQSILDRLAIQRQSLTDKFIAMETALAKAQTLRDSITQTFDALSNSQKNG